MPSTEESQVGGIRDVKGGDERAENAPLVASEEQALALARASPDKALPIWLTFSADDRDNPRNFGKWRKWYITVMVSFLNVVTYVLLYPLSPPCLSRF